MPFSNLDKNWSNLSSYYNSVSNGKFSNPGNVTFTSKPEYPSIRYIGFDDGLVRGGFVNATLASVRDTERIGKFLITGNGGLFGIKQLGLQKSNIPLEKDPNNPNDPTRKYNLGVNLIAQVPINAFGGHLIRHGLLPVGGVGFLEGDSLGVKGYSYERAVLDKDTKDNRLVKYLNKISYNYSNTPIELESYNGGAASVYGIGKTRITTNKLTTNKWYRGTSLPYFRIQQYIDNYRYNAETGNLTLSGDINNLNNELSQINLQQNSYRATLDILDPNDPDITANSKLIDQLNLDASEVQDELDRLKNQQLENTITNIDFRTNINDRAAALESSKLYKSYNIQSQFGVSTSKYGPNNIKKSQKVDSINIINITDGKTHYDNINAKKRSSDVLTSISDKVDGFYGKDIVKFAIEFLNNDSKGLETDLLAFRAYIDDFSDGMNAKWNSYRYMGRGEDFYVYDGFTRDISVAFTIYAHSQEEMVPLYKKLNYLLSTFAPDYNTDNKMRGNIAYLTVGDYLVRQPGIFTDIKLSGMLDTHWEINLDDDKFQAPKHIKVSLSFKPIHTVLPRKVTKDNPFKSNFVLFPPNTTITEAQKQTENPKNPASDNIVAQQNTTTIVNNEVPPEILKQEKTGKKGKKGK